MSISCQAANGNNDYTVINLIWGLPEQTCFYNDRYFSCTLKLDTDYPLSSSVITVGQSDIHVWCDPRRSSLHLRRRARQRLYEYSFFLFFFYLLKCISLYFCSLSITIFEWFFLRRMKFILEIYSEIKMIKIVMVPITIHICSWVKFYFYSSFYFSLRS